MNDVITWTLYMGGFALIATVMFYLSELKWGEVGDTCDLPGRSTDVAVAISLIALFVILTSIGV